MLRMNFKSHSKPAEANRPIFLLATVLFCTLAAGCQQQTKSTPISTIQTSAIRPDEIDAHVRGFTDSFMSRVAVSYDRIIANAKTPEERSWALQSRLGQAVASLTDATGPNPTVNLLDVVVLVTLKRMSIEEYWIPNLLHDDGKDLLAAYRQSEKEIWDLAYRTFNGQQIVELQILIAKWKKENPNQYYTGFIKFTDFVSNAPEASKHTQAFPSSLLGLLYIDPLAGLDPVAQEAHEFRTLSERLVFVAMRIPLIMNIQIEDATDRILTSPEIQRIISSTEQYAKVGDRFNEVIAKYPADFSLAARRAIDQINAAATLQRQAITQQLNTESNQVHSILADARNSVIVARDAAASMNTNTSQTISAAEDGGRRILHQATISAIAVIIVGFLWPAIVIFAYRYAKRRWLGAL
jgi:hypothetical protein